MRVKTILLFFSLWFILGSLSAQTLPFKSYSIEDGLTQSVVYSIMQDSEGYLWFGTQKGVSRFDGVDFMNYSDEHGLVYVMEIVEDKEGNMWFGRLEGGVICLREGEFITYDNVEGLADNGVYSILEDKDGHLWFTSDGAGVFKLKDGKFTNYTIEQGLVHNGVLSAAEDEEGNLWFGTRGGVSCLRKGKFTNYTTHHGLVNNRVFSILEDSRGVVWFGTLGGGVSSFHDGKFTNYTTKQGLTNNNVRSIVEDRYGNIWFGTHGGGVSKFFEGNFTNYNKKHGLASDVVISVFEDKEGNLWFGTFGRGVSRLSGEKFISYSFDQGLTVTSIAEDKKGRIWIGTFEKGLIQIFDGKFKYYATEQGLVSNQVNAILADREGRIWVGTFGDGACCLKEDKCIPYTVEQGLAHNVVCSIEEDTMGNIWFGTFGGASCLRNGEFKTYSNEDGLAGNKVYVIHHDRRGNVWFGTEGGGVSCLRNGKFTNYTTEQGLADNTVLSIFDDNKGDIWFGTWRGLSCFRDGKFINFTTDDGLSDNLCNFIIEDDSGNLWIGTNKGVNRYDGESFKTYTSRDGLAHDETNQGAVYKDHHGNLWFGSSEGVTKYVPELDRLNRIPPPVYITGFRIFEQDTSIVHGLKLRHNQNYLKFDYTGLCFTSPEDVIYNYKLEGLDKDWQTSPLRTVQYTSLRSGKYTFQVTARNNDGVWSEEPAEFNFIITPPFWTTFWFRAVLALVIVGAAFTWYKNRVKTIETQRNKLELQVAERTKELGAKTEELSELNAMKDKFFSIIAHDLKGSLQVQLSGSRLLSDRLESIGKKTIKTIGEELKKNTENLFTLLENLLHWSRIQTGRIEHKPVKVKLNNLVEECLILLTGSAKEKEIALSSDIVKGIIIHADENMIRSVFQNVVSNAIKFTGHGGKVVITSKKIDEFVEISVTDTGVGIAEEDLKKLFRIDEHYTTMGTADEKGSGLGLILCQEFVEKNRGKIWIESRVGQGTTVRFTVPVVV